MGKRIVVCSDGTGNTAIKGRGTNVFKLFEAVDLDTHRFDPAVTPQIAIYDDGVGTENFKPLKLLGGATGWGLSRNVKHLYAELARVYDPGDEIYMFGFSRGAFTVRTLVGLIGACGLIDLRKLRPRTSRAFHIAVKQAYSAYRACYRPLLAQLLVTPSHDSAVRFKRRYSYPVDVRVRFVGVWDTVDGVGLPFHLGDLLNATVHRFKFPDLTLSPIVDRACHALAIDDERQTFHPLMWKETSEDAARITQVWFAGAHSNVGGGYPKQGMSFVALDWMLEEAAQAGKPFGQHGLRLNRSDRDWFREHASVDDKLYDPRAGLGVFYRRRIRDIGKICDAHGVRPRIHVSVLERIAHGTDDYSPGNLPADADAVFTPRPDSANTELARRRAAGVQKVLATLPRRGLLDRVKREMAFGQLSYYMYLLTALVFLASAWHAAPAGLLRDPAAALSTFGALGITSLTDPLDTAARIAGQTWRQPWLFGGLAGGFAIAYLLTLFVDTRMSAEFSGFWFLKQEHLRDALKQARVDTKAVAAPRPVAVPDAAPAATRIA
jgi:Uncharacterized alpha/beta hydrolase domain (DUF2235)